MASILQHGVSRLFPLTLWNEIQKDSRLIMPNIYLKVVLGFSVGSNFMEVPCINQVVFQFVLPWLAQNEHLLPFW